MDQEYCGWLESISHHFETRNQTISSWYLLGGSNHCLGFLKGARKADFATIDRDNSYDRLPLKALPYPWWVPWQSGELFFGWQFLPILRQEIPGNNSLAGSSWQPILWHETPGSNSFPGNNSWHEIPGRKFLEANFPFRLTISVIPGNNSGRPFSGKQSLEDPIFWQKHPGPYFWGNIFSMATKGAVWVGGRNFSPRLVPLLSYKTREMESLGRGLTHGLVQPNWQLIPGNNSETPFSGN